MVLLLINVYGLFASLENDALFDDSDTAFIDDKQLRYAEFESQYPRRAGESAADYLERLQPLISKTIAHYWHTDKARHEYHGLVPIWENYWLYLLGQLPIERFSLYEFFDWQKALERGIGLCSQHALVTTAILNEQQIDARVVLLNGHVVVEAQVAPSQWWIVDTDFGAMAPLDIDQAAANTDAIATHYAHLDQSCRPEFEHCTSVSEVVAFYRSAADNRRLGIGAQHYSPLGYWFERGVYVLKWVFPLGLLGGFWWRQRRNRALIQSGSHQPIT